MHVAIVHDWLYAIGGAERVLRELLRCYPSADVFTMFDVLSPEQRGWIGFERAKTSFLQHIPGISGLHTSLLPLMPFAIEQFDFSGYDLIISSSFAVAKGALTGPDQVHIAYVHSPMRYAWDLQHQYLRQTRGAFGLKRLMARLLLHRIRIWDASSGPRANAIAANSAFVARRIKKASGREVEVIYPPVNTVPSAATALRKDYFLAAGRLVAYKNMQAIVDAFRLLPGLKLVVAGTGPEEKRLRSMAGPNVSFAGFVSDGELRRMLAGARALIFAAVEDFGIVPVEAQAEGTPVLALGRGGARETVVADGPSPTGMFFEEPSAPIIAACVNAFLAREATFSREACQSHAQSFSEERFRTRFMAFTGNQIEMLNREIQACYARRSWPELTMAG